MRNLKSKNKTLRSINTDFFSVTEYTSMTYQSDKERNVVLPKYNFQKSRSLALKIVCSVALRNEILTGNCVEGKLIKRCFSVFQSPIVLKMFAGF